MSSQKVQTADPELALALVEEWILQWERVAYIPIVQDGEPEAGGSKFGGVSHHPRGARTPSCRLCGADLGLSLQLDLASLPGRFGDSSAEVATSMGNRGEDPVLQVYDTSNCGCDDGVPFGANTLCRVIPKRMLSIEESTSSKTLPSRKIMGWKAIVDRPYMPECSKLGLETSYDEPQLCKITSAAFEAVLPQASVDSVNDVLLSTAPGDKLGGWARWAQNADYPFCPRCGLQMGLLFQLDSYDNLATMFGDSGTAHVTQCAMHGDVVAFGWACA